MALRAGTRANFSGSLASSIESAFDSVRAEYGLDPLPADGTDDRRMLYLAIARGIVEYVAANEDAFVVPRHASGTTGRHALHVDGHLRIETQT